MREYNAILTLVPFLGSMRQHPIPQNILDVEFKLFTKFTVKEFAYLAIGVGFGGIFLYLFSVSILPGIIAIPVFLVSALIGSALALLPINEQGADVYMGNFIKAITRPTLRVWRNENFDQKFEWLAKQRGVTLQPGEELNIPNEPKMKKKRVIGGTSKPIDTPSPIVDEDVLDSIEQAELERLAQIDRLVAANSSLTVSSSALPIEAQIIPESNSVSVQSSATPIQAQMTSTTNSPTIHSTTSSIEAQVMSTQTTPQTGNEILLPSVSSINIQSSPMGQNEQQNVVLTSPISSVDPSNTQPPHLIDPNPQLDSANQHPTIEKVTPSASNEIVLPKSSSVREITQVRISAETAEPYKTVVEDYHAEPGKIAIFLSNEAGGVPGALVMIKDAGGNMIQALQSDPQGLVLSRKVLPPGEYTVIIKHDRSNFPEVLFNLENKPIPVVNIRSN